MKLGGEDDEEVDAVIPQETQEILQGSATCDQYTKIS